MRYINAYRRYYGEDTGTVAFSTLSCTWAQSSYVGFHVSGISSSSGITPFGGLQVGGPIVKSVEFRLSGFTIILATLLRLDLLYTQRLSETLRGYAGGGADILQISFTEDGLGSAFATAGAEYGLGSGIGLFAVPPTFVLNAPDTDFADTFGNAGAATFFGTLSLGVNIHF